MSNLFDKFFHKKPPKPSADPNHPFMKTNFKEALLSGKICEEVIMEYVTFWNTYETGKPIEEFLGMTDNQYLDWIVGSPVGLVQLLEVDY